MGIVRGLGGQAVAVAEQRARQVQLGAVDGEDAMATPQRARVVARRVLQDGAVDAQERLRVDLGPRAAQGAGRNRLGLRQRDVELAALVPQLGRRRRVALVAGREHQPEDEQHHQQGVEQPPALHPCAVPLARHAHHVGQHARPHLQEALPRCRALGCARRRRRRARGRLLAGEGPRPLQQGLLPARVQRPHVHRLGRHRRVAALRLAALRLADALPARRPVAGSRVALAVDIGFQQDRPVAVLPLPVGGDLPRRQAQHVRSQVFHADPGQDGHTIPTLGMRRSPSITGSIRWPGSGWSAWGAAPCAAPPSWWLPTRKESAITFLCG